MSIFTPYLTYIKVGAVVLAVVGLAGGGYYKGHHDEAAEFDLYKSQQSAAAAKQAVASQAAARLKEEQNAQFIAATQATAAKSIADNTKRANATSAALRARTISLSSQLASTRKQLGVLGAGTGAGGSATCSSQLPDDTAQFLVSESARADAIAIKYNEALAVIAQDRKVCGGSPTGQ